MNKLEQEKGQLKAEVKSLRNTKRKTRILKRLVIS